MSITPDAHGVDYSIEEGIKKASGKDSRQKNLQIKSSPRLYDASAIYIEAVPCLLMINFFSFPSSRDGYKGTENNGVCLVFRVVLWFRCHLLPPR